MPTVVLVNPDSTFEEIDLNQKNFPSAENLAGEHDPEPFLLNIFYKPQLPKLVEIFGTSLLQWSKVSGRESTNEEGMIDSSEVRVLFPAPAEWTLTGIVELKKKCPLNPTATFVCKHHEIFGKAIFFRVKDEMVDGTKSIKSLKKEDFKQIYDSAKPRLHESEENGGQVKKFDVAENFETPTCEAERRVVRETYARDMCDRRNLISLEMMYLLLNANIEWQYVKNGKAYYNSIPSYPISDDIVKAYILISIEKGATEATGPDYIYMRPDQYQMVRSAGYELAIEKMSKVMSAMGLKYKPPMMTEAEEEIQKKKELDAKEKKEAFFKKLKEKKK